MKTIYALLILASMCGFHASAEVSERRTLRGNISAAAMHMSAIRNLTETNLNLAIALPLRNRLELTNLLGELYDSSTTNFHQWLTSDQFADRFGPSEEDYQKVVRFAEAHGLHVTHTHSNRALLDVIGASTNIETAFKMKLRMYHHPTENRDFFAPDADPTVETNVPILCIGGLDNYIIPRRISPFKTISLVVTNTTVTPLTTLGTSPGGFLMGNDFRNAYVPGVTNTGTGQYIAIIDVGGPYYPLDVYMYETNSGLSTNIVVTNIITTFDSYWLSPPAGPTNDEGEEVLDIDMAMSMAPGATIINYEGEAHDLFNRIATDNIAKQMTLSYGFGIDDSIIQMFQQFAAQGQSFCQASGDGGAEPDGKTGLEGNPYATIVGGVVLSTIVPGGTWQADETWNGSGGGISGYGIPDWQLGIATAANQGSTTYRNFPDVAMPAVNIFTVYKNGTAIGATAGTSAASPLWAGFMALVNQQAATYGKPPAGFINPSIYNLGKGNYSAYTNCFHDIATGNTFNGRNPTRYQSTVGYDLCTGWGTPTGINTVNMLAGIGTNYFTIYATQGSLTLGPGTSGNTTLNVTALNGNWGNVSFSIIGLPLGVTASFSPTKATNTSVLTLAVTNSIIVQSPTFPLTTFPLTIVGTSGGATQTLTFNLNVTTVVPGSIQVTPVYNRVGIYSDRSVFNAGLDGNGFAYSANLLGSKLYWDNTAFTLGSPNVSDVLSCSGQGVKLTQGNYNNLLILATAANGAQLDQNFTMTYTDGSKSTFTQSLSDWSSPENFPGESIVTGMSYRNYGGGVKNDTETFVYGYNFPLDPSKTVRTLGFPSDANVNVLAIALARLPVSVSLATYFNRSGMYADGVTFSNPFTGGIDGSGNAYSSTLVSGALTFKGVTFNFGPANTNNVISCFGQTITLPAGNYCGLQILGAGVQGSQLAQNFTVTYADNSTSTFIQSLSDWVAGPGFFGEAKALGMDYRNVDNGLPDNGGCSLYNYTFALNSSKTVKSLTLPNNGSVIVLAISLIPNWPPFFPANPFTVPHATAGQLYSATISSNAADLNGDTISFSKVSGPSWLSIAANGSLSGTPLSSNVGTNNFVVTTTDSGGLSGNATLSLVVTAAPPVVSTLSFQGGSLQLNWAGGVGPFQVQSTTNLLNPNWQNVGAAVGGNNLSITPSNAVMYYRIIGQ